MLLAGIEVPLWVLLALLSAVLFYWSLTRNFGIFKKAGIPGPKPYPIVGTASEIYGKSLMDADTSLFQKYGSFVGMYDGSLPVLLVFDGAWLKEAFIKNFNSFVDRRYFSFGSTMDNSLFSVTGDHWKFARKMLSPEFSTGKIKKMMPSIQKCVDQFTDILKDENERPVDIRRRTNMLTLDVISQTAFGFDAGAQIEDDNEFSKNAFLLMNTAEANSTLLEKIRLSIVFAMLLLAPNWLNKLANDVFNLGLQDKNAVAFFENLCNRVAEERQQGREEATDFLQTLANNTVDIPKGDSDRMVDEHGRIWTLKGLTKGEVIGNAMLFLFAGFQTTASTMLFFFYELAQNPDAQQRLYEEILSVCDTEEITPEQISDLKYLDRCVQEAMRLYPQSIRFDRVAAEDITVKDIHIKKGTAVTASGWVIHRDPAVWENPEDFDPDRFLPERMTEQTSDAYMPFGIGNRQCIASRLAMIEMKMTFISTLKTFSVEKTEQTPPKPLQFKAAFAIAPEEPIMLTFKKRTN